MVDPLLAEYWETGDRATLSVWADALIERGDPRGEHLQLCLIAKPTTAQVSRRYQLERDHGRALVGPAGQFLSAWRFGNNGLITHATCAASNLEYGLAEITSWYPTLFLTITGLNEWCAKGIAKLPLEKIYYLDLNDLSDRDVNELTEPCLLTAAPAFARVRHLAMVANHASRISPAGLRAFADHMTALELFYFNHVPRLIGTSALPPCSEYADVVATCAGFQTLKALIMPGASESVRKLPNVATFDIGLGARAPRSWEYLERLKRGQTAI